MQLQSGGCRKIAQLKKQGEMVLQGSRTTVGKKNHQSTLQKEVATQNIQDCKNVNNVNIVQNVTSYSSVQCMFTNCDSLPNKMDELKALVDLHKPKIIGLNEIKPKNSRYQLRPAELSLEDYQPIFQKNIDNNTGLGVAIYIHNSIPAIEYKMENTHQESVWVEAKINKKDSLLIGCIYNSPSSDNKNHEDLRKLIMQASNQGFSHVLIMGDFNYRNINWETKNTNRGNENSEDYKFIETMRDSFLTQHIIKPTRARGTNKPSTLDLVMTNEEGMIQEIEYLSPLGKSDHTVLQFKPQCYLELADHPKLK